MHCSDIYTNMDISQSTEAMDSYYFMLQIITRVLMIWAVCLSKVLFIKSGKTFKLCLLAVWMTRHACWWLDCFIGQSRKWVRECDAECKLHWMSKERKACHSQQLITDMPYTSYAISLSAWVNCQVWAPFNSLGWVNSLFNQPQLFLVWMQCLPGT